MVTEFLFTAEEGYMLMTLNCAYTSCASAAGYSIDAVSDSESSIFLQWVWLAIGATPTRQPKVFGVARLAGLGEYHATHMKQGGHLQCTVSVAFRVSKDILVVASVIWQK